MRPFLSLLALLLAPLATLSAQPADNPLTFVQAGKWAEAQAAAARFNDPVADKTMVYYRVLTPNAASASEVAAFIRQNPDWPLPTLLERRRQEAIAAERDHATAAALCVEKKPATTAARAAALFRCADALASTGRGQDAAVLAREAWVSAISDASTEAAFERRFPGLITSADQWARFQRLAWDDAGGAQRQMIRLDALQAGKAAGRLGLKANTLGYTARPEEEPGAMLDLARAYRRMEQNALAVALWLASGGAAQKTAPDKLDLFWTERHQLTRKLLKDGDAQSAYAVISGHGQTDPAVVAEAEFLAGFIALRRLNDPRAAARHFTALAAASPAVLTQSRAYYWLGRAKTASGGDGRAEYMRAAAWPMTFYGQLAARAAGVPDATLVGALRAGPAASSGVAATPGTAELAKAARLLVSWGDPRRARVFLMRMEEIARTPGERIGTADQATALGIPDIAILITRRLGRDGIMPPMQGWPTPYEPPSALVEPAVALSIMRQESNFDVGIASPAGARGLMQLMPATAAQVAKRLGEPTSAARLTTDPGHNMRLGTAYLREVLDKFDSSVPMAAAAYNAGPNRVTQWIGDNGDPRVRMAGGTPAGGMPMGGMIDWIEMIPFNETRNYVQRVMENIVVYEARRTGALPAAMPQWSQ